MDARTDAALLPPPKITFRKQGPTDPCWVRDQWLEPGEEKKALSEPATRRLLVDGAGHYVDRHHGHVNVLPRGVDETRVFMCVKGSGWLQIGSSRRRVTPGSAALIPAHLPHSYGPTELPWSIWWCSLVGTDAIDLLKAAAGTPGGPVIHVRDTPRLVSIIDEIATIYERESSPATILEATGAAWKLVTRIGVDQTRWERSDPLANAMDHLATHVEDWVPVPDLAALVGVSQARLNSMFQVATGKGVLAYQIEQRMTKARRLLEETDASVSDVARQVGYTDPYYFSRHFRRANGTSPTRFRQERAEAE